MTTTMTMKQERDSRAGCVQLRRNRETGTVIGIYENVAAGLDDSDGTLPYSTVCEDHGQCVAHPSLTLAKSHAPNPTGWCEECMKPKELRESEAYADDPEGATKLWDNDYRPIKARALRVGMTVAFVDLDVFGLQRTGGIHYARVTKIDPLGEGEPWGFLVEHTGGNPAEVDELTEVWAQ